MSTSREARQIRELVLEADGFRRQSLVPDLKACAQRKREELRLLFAQQVTGEAFEVWVGALVEEVSATWIMVGLLVRLTEDFGLAPYLGTGEPGGKATEREVSNWIQRLAALLIPREHPGALLDPSEHAQQRLAELFREHGGEAPRWRDAVGVPWLTADLYQQLAPRAREQHAFILTPDFIAEFLVEQTVGPAIREFGLNALQIIDPACGSGLLLTESFKLLMGFQGDEQPRGDAERARMALAQLHGADISLFACAVTRCALIQALLRSVSSPEQVQLETLPLNITVTNILLDFAQNRPVAAELVGRYHVVLTEPPFTVERDPELRAVYRRHFVGASQKFSLESPFVELAFALAVEDGYVGALLSSSFMKREYGKPLIEEVLARNELMAVIDTSGVYIPGHGIPTVLLLARRRSPVAGTVRVVAGHRGEPITPASAREGKVWIEIKRHFGTPGFQGSFVSVADLPRADFDRHPWAIAAGPTLKALNVLERKAPIRLNEIVRGAIARPPGPGDILAEPEVFLRQHVAAEALRLSIRGDQLSDWSLVWSAPRVVPDLSRQQEYQLEHLLLPCLGGLARHVGPLGGLQPEDELTDAVARLFSKRVVTAGRGAVLLFSRLALQNHFSRSPSGEFLLGAVVGLELSWPSSDEERSLALLAYLNSSTAWFWMQQKMMSKSLTEFTGKYRRDIDATMMLFELSPQQLMQLPVPEAVVEPGPLRQELAGRARRLETLAERHRGCAPRFVVDGVVDLPGTGMPAPEHQWDGRSRVSLIRSLAWARHDEELLFREMVVQQEEIDWLIYSALGEARIQPLDQGRALPEQRPFAWVKEQPPGDLAADVEAEWSERRRQRASNSLLQILDAKPCKRGWRARESRSGKHDLLRATEACERWLLRRIEHWFQIQPAPHPVAAGQLAEVLSYEPDVVAVVEALSPVVPDMAKLLSRLLDDEAVPFLKALRFRPSGLEKSACWDQLWALQRQRPVKVGEAQGLAVPYTYRDFRQPAYWRLRGRLDFPRERFISYPAEVTRGKTGLIFYGWAGWTLPQRAEALQGFFQARQAEGWTNAQLVPILQGIEELLPRVQDWYPDKTEGLHAFAVEACRSLGLTREALAEIR